MGLGDEEILLGGPIPCSISLDTDLYKHFAGVLLPQTFCFPWQNYASFHNDCVDPVSRPTYQPCNMLTMTPTDFIFTSNNA